MSFVKVKNPIEGYSWEDMAKLGFAKGQVLEVSYKIEDSEKVPAGSYVHSSLGKGDALRRWFVKEDLEQPTNEELVDFITRPLDASYKEINFLEAIHNASDQASLVRGHKGMDDLLVLFCNKCEDFTGLITILTATFSYRENLPSRESCILKVRGCGYRSMGDSNQVDAILKGLE
jgi:hypothetical protein